MPDAASRLAAEDCIDLAESAGLVLDEWQRTVIRGALGETSAGKWQTFEVGLIVPRQNGKGAILEALELFWLFLCDEDRLILHSAHEFKTAREGFLRIRGLIEATPDLREQVKQFYASTGGECGIELLDGKRLRFVARSNGAGRGFSPDKLVLDEAYNLPESAIDAVLPSVGARPNPQVWYTSSPGDITIAPCDVLARVRRRGIKGEDPALAFFEWSVDYDDDGKIKGSPDDPKLWAQANPSMGIRKQEDRIANFQRSMSAGGFAREELGVGTWPADEAGGALPYDRWLTLADPKAERGSEVMFGADVTADRIGWVAVAWRRPDGGVQVMVDDQSPMPAYRLADRCAELTRQWGGSVVPPRAFEEEASNAGASVEPMKQGEFAAACGAVLDAITEGSLHHGNQPALNGAVRTARWRSAGTAGERAFQLKDAPEVGPLAAVTRAFHGLTTISGGVLLW